MLKHHSESKQQDESLEVRRAKQPASYNSAGQLGGISSACGGRGGETIDEQGEKQQRDKQMVAKCSIHTRVAAGRGAAGAAVEATLRLAEIIAVMDRSYSPEHTAPAAAQQDDFADLHVRPL